MDAINHYWFSFRFPGPFFTQQDPFDDSEETDSGEMDSDSEEILQFINAGHRMKGSSSNDAKGAFEKTCLCNIKINEK